MKVLIGIFIIGCICLTACAPYTHDDLVGKWSTVGLTEEGDSLAVNLEDINFLFTENGRYEFNSTLRYKEAGTYRLEGRYLYSRDTLTEEALNEKAVEIKRLSNDTLVLRMQETGKERLLLLKKQ